HDARSDRPLLFLDRSLPEAVLPHPGEAGGGHRAASLRGRAVEPDGRAPGAAGLLLHDRRHHRGGDSMTSLFNPGDLRLITPELVLTLGAFLVLGLSALPEAGRKLWAPALAGLTCLMTLL